MNKEGVKKLQYERDMLLCKYIALCEMMADMLNLDTEEIEEIRGQILKLAKVSGNETLFIKEVYQD